MALKSRENKLGAYAFLVGVVLAVLIGLSTTLISLPSLNKYSPQIYGILLLLGILVGFMNVTGKDSQTFMIAGTVLVIVSASGMNAVTGSLIGIRIGSVAREVFGALLALFVPATIIVALKTVFSIAKV